MRFLDNLSKTLSSGVDRAKFEADKFQRTSKINSEIGNFKSQIDTNMRQLGERALELYQQGSLQAPEIASLAQIIAQLRAQLGGKERELEQANAETFEALQAAPAAPQNVPVAREPVEGSFPTPTAGESAASPSFSTDVSGSGLPNTASVVGSAASVACASCGYALPGGSAFCPNCGARVASQ
jgi:hypothetical protein